jgi:SSS family solute:Na+ symporter
MAACLSVATAYIVLFYNNLMDYLQLIFSLFNAPLFAVFLFGMFTRWATPTAGFWGLLCGAIAASAHSFAIHSGIIVYGSQLSGDFYGAIFGWIVAAAVTATVSLFTVRKPTEDLDRVTYFSSCMPRQRISPVTWGLVAVVLALFLLLNFIFR